MWALDLCPVVLTTPNGPGFQLVSLEDNEKLGGMATRAGVCGQRGDSQRLWKMKIPMALEQVQSASGCPSVLITKTSRDSQPRGLVPYLSPTNSFFYMLCLY